MAKEPATKTIAKLPCPQCGSAEGSIMLDLNAPHGVLECGECSEHFTVEEAVEMARENLRRWSEVAEWIASIPVG